MFTQFICYLDNQDDSRPHENYRLLIDWHLYALRKYLFT